VVLVGWSWCSMCMVIFLWSSGRNRLIEGDGGDRASGQFGAIMQATFVRSLSGFAGDASLYRVEPHVKWAKEYDATCNPVYADTEYVIVSTVTVEYTGPETYIFLASEEGKVTFWGELRCSYRGGLDHAEALRRAGYEVREESTVNVNAGKNEVNDV